MTELEGRVRDSIRSATQGSAVTGPDAADLLVRAHRARAVRHRATVAGIAASCVVALSLVVLFADRDDHAGPPTAGTSTPTVNAVPADWKLIEDSGLELRMPSATLVNPAVCPKDGRSYVLTAGRNCENPDAAGAVQPAPIVVWILDGPQGKVPQPPKDLTLQTVNRDGLSGFVTPMSDPGFLWQTRGASYTWTLIENTTTTTIYLFGKDQQTAQQVIDSLQVRQR